MDFFPGPPDPPNEDEVQEQPQPVWMNPPEDVLPGVVPVELVLGRSASTVVALTGMRAFPTGLQMNLAVRVRGRVSRRDLNSEVRRPVRPRHGSAVAGGTAQVGVRARGREACDQR